MNNWSGKKKVFAIFGSVFVIVGLILTIFLVQKVQETRSRAEKATVLSLTPTNQNIEAGKEGQLSLVVNPGSNQVNFIKTAIVFDKDKFNLTDDSFKLDSTLGLSFIEQPKVQDGVLTFVVGVGNDPTKVITRTESIGKIDFTVKDDATDGDSDVNFDEENTQVRSVGATDPFTQNVLSSTVRATITVGAAICKANIATCSWDSSEGNVSFHFKVTDTKDDSVILEGDTDKTKIEFPSVPGKTYKCEVNAFNPCGESPLAEGTSVCPTPTLTPTPTPTITTTPTESPTPSPTEEITETPVPTEITPTIEVTSTPSTPTEIVFATSTPTPTVGLFVTPVPTLPPTGNPFVIGGILGGVLFILGGMALLFL